MRNSRFVGVGLLISVVSGCFAPGVAQPGAGETMSTSGTGSEDDGGNSSVSSGMRGDTSTQGGTTGRDSSSSTDANTDAGTTEEGSDATTVTGGAGGCLDRCAGESCRLMFLDDPNNCGGCEVECVSGECHDGFCVPELVAIFDDGRSLAVWGDDVFAGGAGDDVLRFQSDGSMTVVSSGQGEQVAVGADYLYVASSDAISRMDYDGSGVLDVSEPPDAEFAFSLEQLGFYEERLYWVQEWGNSISDRREHLMSISDGGGGLVDHSIFEGEDVVLIGAVGGDVYFYSSEDGDIGRSSVSAPNDQAEVIVTGRAPRGQADVTELGVFWMEAAGEQTNIVRADLDGGDIDTVATLPGGPGLQVQNAVVQVEGAVFWIRNQQLYGCSVEQCDPVLVDGNEVGGAAGRALVASAERTLVWFGGGGVRRIPVPSTGG